MPPVNNPTDDLSQFAEDYVGVSASFDGRPLTLEEIQKAFAERNPLAITKDRVFVYKCPGSFNQYAGGMHDNAHDETIGCYQRSNEERPDFDYRSQGIGDEPLEREGDVSHSYVMSVKIETVYNNSPIPFGIKIQNIPGNTYQHVTQEQPQWQIAEIMYPEHPVTYQPPKSIYSLPANLDLAEAVALDNMDIEEIKTDLAQFPSDPEWTIVKGGITNPLLKLLAKEENVHMMKTLGLEDTTKIDPLAHFGEVVVIPTVCAQSGLNTWQRKIATAAFHVKRVDLNKFGVEFVPVSSKAGITMATLRQHEFFDGMEASEVEKIMNKPFLVSCKLHIDYALKDSVLEEKINQHRIQRE